MSSITALTRIFFVSAACCALFACGKANDQAPALSSVNKHPDTWLTEHRVAYRQKPDSCRECHGPDLLGGVTKIGCSTNSCHSGNHPPRDIIHPIPFKGTTDLNKAHGAMAKKDLTICQACHGKAGGAGSNPRFNLVFGSLSAGCESSGCHNLNMAHPKPWQTHASSGNQPNSCALCHGANFEGSAASGAPSCKSCHSLLTGIQLPVVKACDSCHGNSTISNIPSFNGSHAKHLALPELKNNCAACHSGGGSDSNVHLTYNSNRTVVVGILAAFTAKNGGAPSINASTKMCSNVICHGGQTTPAWGGVVAGCLSCHSSNVGQYNSFLSGKHLYHVNTQQLACTDCHDMTKLAAPTHFSNLSSSTMNQSSASTLRSYVNYTKPSCSPAVGNQVGVCHGTRVWQ